MIFEQYSLILVAWSNATSAMRPWLWPARYTVSFIKLEISWRIIFRAMISKMLRHARTYYNIELIELKLCGRLLEYWNTHGVFYFRNDKNRNRQLFPLWDDVYLAISMNSNDASNFYYCADSLTNQSADQFSIPEFFMMKGNFLSHLVFSARVHRLSESRSHSENLGVKVNLCAGSDLFFSLEMMTFSIVAELINSSSSTKKDQVFSIGEKHFVREKFDFPSMRVRNFASLLIDGWLTELINNNHFVKICINRPVIRKLAYIPWVPVAFISDTASTLATCAFLSSMFRMGLTFGTSNPECPWAENENPVWISFLVIQ